MTIDVCLTPELYKYYKANNDTVIVTDILRASSTICTMLHNGAKAVIPVANIEEAKRYKNKGVLVGAERNAERVDFADFGNSPFEYTPENVKNKRIVLTTSNGTQAIETALALNATEVSSTKECKELLIGAFVNIDTLADYCAQNADHIVVICAGTMHKVSLEDTLFAGAFIDRMMQRKKISLDADATRIAFQVWNYAREDPFGYLVGSSHFERLRKLGLEADIRYSLKSNVAPVLPVYNKIDKSIEVYTKNHKINLIDK